MPAIQCPIEGCQYETEDVEASIAAALILVHGNIHKNESFSSTCKRQKPPKLDRPHIGLDASEETWNSFITRWKMFTESSELTPQETVRQLFHCCEEDLGDKVLKGHPDAVSGDAQQLLEVIKKLAVVPVAVSVRRAELLSTRQDHGENIRSYVAKLQGKAATCNYSMVCSKSDCTQINNFTDTIVKDVVVAGLVDDEIKKEVLGWADLDDKNIEETVNFIEGKEMARDALMKQTVNAGISTYKSRIKGGNSQTQTDKISCKDCGDQTEKFVWSKKQGRKVESSLCITCWKKSRSKRGKTRNNYVDKKDKDEVNALFVGAIKSSSIAKASYNCNTIRQRY